MEFFFFFYNDGNNKGKDGKDMMTAKRLYLSLGSDVQIVVFSMYSLLDICQ